MQQCKFAQKVCNIAVCNNFCTPEKFATFHVATFKKCQIFLQHFFATKMLQKLVFATSANVAKNFLNHNLSRTRTAQGTSWQGSGTSMGKPEIISRLEPTELQFLQEVNITA